MVSSTVNPERIAIQTERNALQAKLVDYHRDSANLRSQRLQLEAQQAEIQAQRGVLEVEQQNLDGKIKTNTHLQQQASI